MEFTLPRGMRDLEPDEYEALERVRTAFLEVAGLFGFRLMEPSPIEMLQTLEAKSGPGIRDEVYHFRDKADREVGLRFDLTVGLTRYVASKRDIPLPAKIGAFSGNWRYDEPQFGRYRWFYQWDAEIFGSKHVDADAEVIEFTSTLFDRLGLDASVEVGDREVVEEFIRRRLKIEDNAQILTLLRAVDKLERKAPEEVLKEYKAKGVDANSLQRLVEFGSLKGEPRKILQSIASEGLEQAGNIIRLVESLDARGMSNLALNMGVVRGLDYYTGIVFEVFDRENRDIGALAGGGRYDILPEVFGRGDLGATGVAGGVERTILALSKAGAVRQEADLMVFVGYTGGEMAKVASGLASKLRRSGVPVDIEISGRSLRKQIEYASKSASLFVIVGPREYSEGKVTLRDMRSGEEAKVRLEELESKVKAALSGGVHP